MVQAIDRGVLASDVAGVVSGVLGREVAVTDHDLVTTYGITQEQLNLMADALCDEFNVPFSIDDLCPRGRVLNYDIGVRPDISIGHITNAVTVKTQKLAQQLKEKELEGVDDREAEVA